MKMERALNNLVVRFIIGVGIGMPLSVLVVMYGIHGLVLGYVGIVREDILYFLFGVITVIGLIGIIGAWWRLLRTTTKMTGTESSVVRLMLFCGVICSLGLAAWSAFLEEISELSLFFMILALAGCVFVFGTPKYSNIRPNSGAE